MDENGAPTSHRGRRRALLAAGAGAVVVAAITTTVLVWPSGKHPHDVAAPPPVVVVAPSSTPAPTIPPSPAPSPTKPTVPHQFVPPAVPTAFTLSGHGFTIRAHVCAMAPIFPLDPPGEQHHTVCWVTKGFGYMPSSRSRTSYVLGHSWAEDPLEVLNAASRRATREILRESPQRLDGVPVFPAKSLVGATITLRTPRGTLGYRVRSAFGVDKYRLGDIAGIMNPNVRNRVVLITCAELHGVDYHYNVVLDARLVSSQRR